MKFQTRCLTALLALLLCGSMAILPAAAEDGAVKTTAADMTVAVPEGKPGSASESPSGGAATPPHSGAAVTADASSPAPEKAIGHPDGTAYFAALPDNSYATAAALFADFYSHGYPDYIGGVWTDNGTEYPLIFSLTDDAAGEAGRADLLRLIADDESIRFRSADYSLNELRRIQDDLFTYMGNELGFITCGANEKTNRLDVGILQSAIGNEATEDFIEMLKLNYGGRIHIEYVESVTTDILSAPIGSEAGYQYAMGETGHGSTPRPYFGAVVLVAILLLLGGTVGMVFRRRAVAVTAAGATRETDSTAPLTLRRTEQAIKEGEVAPPADLEDKVLNKFKK